MSMQCAVAPILALLCLVTGAYAEEGGKPEPSSSGDKPSDSRRVLTTGSGVGMGQSVRLHGNLSVAKAVAGYQSQEFGWGGAALAAAEWGPSKVWGIQLEAGITALGEVAAAPPDGLRDLGGAFGAHLAIGLRGRPLSIDPGISWGQNLWLSVAVGGTFTGPLLTPVMDAFVGYDFFPSEGWGLGPSVGYMMVLETRDAPREGNAHLMLLGVHGSYDFGSPPMEAIQVDSDWDGIVDQQDACPENPEDKDGFEDEDGCPDDDNDEDGLEDIHDRCPLDAEDRDGFEDEDGCPDQDNDRDSVPDTLDKCPLEAEDLDEFEDEDGCPDLDNDSDRIPDLRDLCPNEPETWNGTADNDGCPDTESVRIVGDKIELAQKVHFWTNSDKIRAMSYPVLDKLATFLNNHLEYVHVDIEGHADSRGDEKFNLDVSRRRAASIEAFLVKRRVDAARLGSDGFGSSRPLVEGSSEHNWFMNRRVEFIVTRNPELKSGASKGVNDRESDSKSPAFGQDKTPREGEAK